MIFIFLAESAKITNFKYLFLDRKLKVRHLKSSKLQNMFKTNIILAVVIMHCKQWLKTLKCQWDEKAKNSFKKRTFYYYKGENIKLISYFKQFNLTI